MPLMFGLDNILSDLAQNKKPYLSANINPRNQTQFDQKLLGSNVVAVNPSRSADGHTRIAINSHQPWTGPVAWYVVHL